MKDARGNDGTVDQASWEERDTRRLFMPWNKIERLRDDHRDDMLGQNRSRGY
jgi:hypothetical protein